MKILKKYSVKVPENIKIIYVYDKDFITFAGPLGVKSLKLKLKLQVQNAENLLYVTKKSTRLFSSKQKKVLASLQGSIAALLKRSILEISTTLYKKLELVGVGYRVSLVENITSEVLRFKLGFSHPIFFKIENSIQVTSFKSTNLYLFGNSYDKITLLASIIRSYKFPEPYKGKGILYQNEKIRLKEGKKT